MNVIQKPEQVLNRGRLALRAVVVVLAVFIFVSGLAVAQEEEPVSESPSDGPVIPEVVVEGVIPFADSPDLIWETDSRRYQGKGGLFDGGRRTNLSLFESPSLRSIIDLRELTERAPIDMFQALEREVGVLVQRTQRGAAAPFVRGLTGQQVLILVDGIRMNNATFRLGPNQYFNTIDPGMVDHIEVIRGPQTVLYGSDAFGGVINVVTRRTAEGGTPDGPLKTWYNRYSSADNGFYSRMNWQHYTGDTGIFAGAGYANVNSLDRGGDLGRQPWTDFAQYSGDIRIDRKIAENQMITYSFQQFVQEDVARSDRFPNRLTVFDPQQRTMAYVRLQGAKMGTFFDTYSLTFSYQRQREGSTDRRFSKNYYDVMETDNQSLGMTLVMNTKLSEKDQLVYGADLYYDDVDAFRDRYEVGTNSYLSSPTPKYPDDGLYRQTGAFVQWDHAINDRLSSTAGVRGSSMMSPYSTSKHAVIGLMRSAALEGSGMGIRVNTVNPSPIQTRMMRSIETQRLEVGGQTFSTVEDIQEATAESSPLKRYGEPEEVAKLMLFLASDDSSYCSGGVYMVDGAVTAGRTS